MKHIASSVPEETFLFPFFHISSGYALFIPLFLFFYHILLFLAAIMSLTVSFVDRYSNSGMFALIVRIFSLERNYVYSNNFESCNTAFYI